MATANSINQLQDIAQQGRVVTSYTPEQTISFGNRMKNKFIRSIVKKYQDEGKLDNSVIIELVLAMDEMIEAGTLTEDLIKTINKDPSLLINKK